MECHVRFLNLERCFLPCFHLNIQVLSKAFGGADSLPPSAVATAPASPVVAWQDGKDSADFRDAGY